MNTTYTKRVLAAGLVALATLGMSGCSSLDWAGMSKSASTLKAEASENKNEAKNTTQETKKAEPTVTASPTAIPTPVQLPVYVPNGDLISGSQTKSTSAGSATLKTDYWADIAPINWTPNSRHSINFASALQNVQPKLTYKVSTFTATVTYDDGTSEQITADAGDFTITPPYTYNNTMFINTKNARKATVTLQWNLLVETARKSNQYYRQSVTDNLNLAFANDTVVLSTSPISKDALK